MLTVNDSQLREGHFFKAFLNRRTVSGEYYVYVNRVEI